MAEKITYLTPTERLEPTFREEYSKAIMWSNKFFKNRRKFIDKEQETIKRCESQQKPLAYPDAQEYVSSAGNHWLVNRLYLPGTNNDDRVTKFIPLIMMYGLTDKYFWVLTCYYEGNGFNWNMVLFTPHFIQRFYERVGIDTSDRMRVMRNLQELLYNFSIKITKENVPYCGVAVYGRLPGCVCYGHKDKNGVIVFSTVIPDAHMMHGKLNQSKAFRKTSDFINSKDYDYAIEMCFYHDKPCKFFREYAKAHGMDGKSLVNQLHYIGMKILIRRLLLEYIKVEPNHVWRDDMERREMAVNAYKFMFVGTTLKHHFQEYEPFLQEIIHTYFEAVNDFAFEKALKVMREICGDHYVAYDRYHIIFGDKKDSTLKICKL